MFLVASTCQTALPVAVTRLKLESSVFKSVLHSLNSARIAYLRPESKSVDAVLHAAVSSRSQLHDSSGEKQLPVFRSYTFQWYLFPLSCAIGLWLEVRI